MVPERMSGVEVGELRTTFPVSPSKDYTIVDLLLGKVGMEIIVPETTETGVMVGTDGGRLVDADGNILAIPQGALGQTTPVSTKTAAAATGAVGEDFILIRAVEVNLTRQTLGVSATISIPAPDGFNLSLPLIVAKQIDVKGVAKLKLVALARQSGSFINSEPLTPQLTNSTNSINSSGVYYFLQAKKQLGFISGTVTDSGNASFNGALVKTDKGSLVDLSAATGKYLTAAPVDSVTATATDLYKNDAGSATSTITAANKAITIDLKILMIPPTVVSLAPTGVNVQPSVPVVVTFSKNMDQNTINSTTLKLINSDGSAVSGVFTYSVDNKIVTFTPSELLKSEQGYTVTISGSVKDLQGYPLGSDATTGFTVRKTTPPPMPPAGSITATFPDADGFITVTATQGSAEAGNTVLLINDTTGEIQSVTPQTNGSFTGKIRAQLGDEIKVVLIDYSGNQTLISYITYKSDDGKYLVTAKGGKVEGEGGSLLDIPEGALVGPAIVRITPVAEVNLPHPLPGPGKYLGAVNLDSGGIGFQKKVDISLPLPAGFDPATPVFLTKPGEIVNIDGTVEKVYEIIDSTKVVNGRITTACWPYDGVLAAGTYAFTAFPELVVGIISGYTYQDMNEQSGYQPTSDGLPEVPTGRAADNTLIYHYDRPVRGAVIRSAQSWNYVSYSRNNGFYSAFTHYYNNIGTDGCRDYQIVAIHPLTMQRVAINGSACAPPYNIEKLNFKLADKGTIPPDRSAPLIDMRLQVVPGQPDANRIVAGTTISGTKLKLPLSIIDQAMGTATLTVQYKEPGGTPAPDDHYAVDIPTGEFYSFQKEEQAQLYKYDGIVKFNPDPTLNYFTVNAPGYYTFILEAWDAAKNKNSRTLELHVIQAGASLGTPLPGPPHVDAISPDDNSKDIMVTTQIVATFSEPVQNVIAYSGTGLPAAATFKLIDVSTGELVPATVMLGIEGGRMQATLTPKGNLYYARDYKIVLTTGIIDTDSTPTAMAADFVATFRTKDPKAYDLATSQQFSGGRDIDLYTFIDTAGETDTYAYIVAGNNGWRIVDVTDPTESGVVHTASTTCASTGPECRHTPKEFNFRSVAVHPDSSRELMAMTENIDFNDGNQYGYIRFYDLSLEPGNPPVIGREKLAEAYSGIPGKVALYSDYAVVNTSGVGVQVVNSKQAIKNQADNKPSDGSAIAGTLDTIGQGYGSPNDLAIFNERSAVFTTNPGWLLAVDLNLPIDQVSIDNNDPVLPLVMNAFKPDGYSFTKIGVATGFPYTDGSGMGKSINLAVAAISQGKIITLDLSDMNNPQILGEVSTSTTADASGVPIIPAIRDISVSKDAGLAYVTTYNSIQVYDIKNQAKPKLLNEIKALPDPSGATRPDGSPVMIPIGETPAIVEKGGWVYLANMTKGFRVLDLDPVTFKLPKSKLLMAIASGAKVKSVKSYEIPYEIQVNGDTDNCVNPSFAITENGSTIVQNVLTKYIGSIAISADYEFDPNADYRMKLWCTVKSKPGDTMSTDKIEESLPVYLAFGQLSVLDIKSGDPMKGAVTDGKSLLEIRLQAGKNYDKLSPPPVLTLSADDAENIADTGTISFGKYSGNRLELNLIEGNGIASVDYQVPVRFIRFGTNKEGSDKTSPERQVQLRIDSVGDMLPKITLKRPPVNLVHGVWADAENWNKFIKILNASSQYDVFTTNYKDTNAESFKSNYQRIEDEIDDKILDVFRDGFAISKINYIGHSMGGLLFKEYCINSGNCNNTINKYVSIDSPLKGSELANIIIDVNAKPNDKCYQMLLFMESVKKQIWADNSNRTKVAGAIIDLAVGSMALEKQKDYMPTFPWRAIVGRADAGSYGDIPYWFLWSGLKSKCGLVPDSSFPTSTWYESFKTVFPDTYNDRIVSGSSQGGNSSNIIIVDHVNHSTTLSNEDTVNAARQFIEE